MVDRFLGSRWLMFQKANKEKWLERLQKEAFNQDTHWNPNELTFAQRSFSIFQLGHLESWVYELCKSGWGRRTSSRNGCTPLRSRLGTSTPSPTCGNFPDSEPISNVDRSGLLGTSPTHHVLAFCEWAPLPIENSSAPFGSPFVRLTRV